MSETKGESNSTSPVKEYSSGDTKTDESSKDSEDQVIGASEESAKDESEEEGLGLLDRPVEVSGCRARKKVERFEMSFSAPAKEKNPIPEGRGKKLGDCPRIEHQIKKKASNDLKPLHRLLFNRVGGPTEIKRNIRRFSGFAFANDSPEYDKLKSRVEKLTGPVLKKICGVCDVERSGKKEEIVKRLLEFLMEPKDSGKPAPKKKTKSKRKSPGASKAAEKKASGGEDSANDSSKSDEKEESDNDSDSEPLNKKSKAAKQSTDKKEKEKKEDKESKKKREEDSDNSDDKPASKKKKGPSDDDLKTLVKKILKGADLQEITMKKVIKQVADAYPSVDLSHKKAFIKATIKSSIHG